MSSVIFLNLTVGFDQVLHTNYLETESQLSLTSRFKSLSSQDQYTKIHSFLFSRILYIGFQVCAAWISLANRGTLIIPY